MSVSGDNKVRVLAMKNSVPIAYIRSVSYKNGTFTLTDNKLFAKTYSNQYRAMKDIDTASYEGLNRGIVFVMDY